VTRTLAYLIVTTFRNRIVVMARRVKRPRYAVGLLLGLAYAGFFIWGQLQGAKQARAGLLQNDAARTVAPLVIALVLLTTWFGGATLSILAYTRSEVAMLFPAPLSRRALILYKLASAQVPIIFNALILAFIFGRGPAGIPRWMAPLSLWTTFSTLQLHRIGAALAYSSAVEHGKSGFKRNWFSQLIGILIVVSVFGAFMLGPMQAADGGRPAGGSPGEMIRTLIAPLETPVFQAVLYPFSIIIAPAFARSMGEWLSAMVPALLMLGLHAWWVLRSQVAFEEAAVEASMRRHEVLKSWRTRGTVAGPRKAREGFGTITLAATGNPAIAILWKNTLCFFRTFRPMQLFASMIMPIAVGGYFGFKNGEGATAVAGICGLFALVMFMSGGSTVRNDLRADMLNLPQLKTLPLRGREIVFAEVASSAIPLALIQLVLLLAAVTSLQLSKHPLPDAVALSIVATLPFGLAGLNMLTSTIRNGVTVLFPSWTKLGVEGGASGFEVIGQAMLSMLAMFITFLVLMIVPALVTLFMVMYVQPPAAISVVFSVIVGASAVAGESYLLMMWLGRVFEKTEPLQSITAS
jgi:ABC-2 type transport system permease protein